MNDNERDYRRSIGPLPEEGYDPEPLGEWTATPEGQALHARLKAAAERMEARIPRSYKRTDRTWGEAHKEELPDVIQCDCGAAVRRWSCRRPAFRLAGGDKRDYPQGGRHLCPLDETKTSASQMRHSKDEGTGQPTNTKRPGGPNPDWMLPR